jgi:hypothetical protein
MALRIRSGLGDDGISTPIGTWLGWAAPPSPLDTSSIQVSMPMVSSDQALSALNQTPGSQESNPGGNALEQTINTDLAQFISPPGTYPTPSSGSGSPAATGTPAATGIPTWTLWLGLIGVVFIGISFAKR